MRSVTALIFAGALLVSVPAAFADDLIIAPEVGVHFHNDVKVKKLKARKYDRELVVGAVIDGDIEYYDVPEDVVVVTPRLKSYKYAYINDHVYLVEPSDHRIIAIVE
jgi:hypothetical protein